MEAQDPGAPVLPQRKEIALLCGFLLCVAIAVASLVLPELSGGEPANQPPQTADGGPSAR
jgi:hypothetical protein